MVYEVAQAILSLAIVFIAAKVLKSLGETFHGRHTFTQAFTTIAYGLSPLFVLRLLDMFPSINPWTTWTVGIVLCMAVFYQGVPRIGRQLLYRPEALSPTVRAIAWKAQLRLTGRFRRLVARGKANPKVATAIARELTGFVWAIAREVPPPAA